MPQTRFNIFSNVPNFISAMFERSRLTVLWLILALAMMSRYERESNKACCLGFNVMSHIYFSTTLACIAGVLQCMYSCATLKIQY